jgi:MoaA/NifB/PqqE/SkfB family radical SAM enzyme
MSHPRLSTLIFEVTQACNHACLHCYNYWSHPDWQGPRLDSRATDVRPLLAHVLDQVECSHVTLTGGEPLLREDLPEIVSFLAGRGVSVTLISNGHLLTEDATADLIQRGVALFELPLLSFRRETHDLLSGSKGAFDAVLAALANISR